MALTQGALVGEIRTFAFGAGISDPRMKLLRTQGWATCAGQSVSQDDFPELFNAIGTTWGSVDPRNVFNLPDLRGFFQRGWDNGAGHDPDVRTRVASAPGGVGGDNVGSLEVDNVVDHRHRLDNFNYAQLHNAEFGNGIGVLANIRGGSTDGCMTPWGSETRPKNIFVMYCIFVGRDASKIPGLLESESVNDKEATDLLARIQEQTQALFNAKKQPSKAELCKVYKELKPLIEALLPWIEKLPRGKQIAEIVRFLMKIADELCG